MYGRQRLPTSSSTPRAFISNFTGARAGRQLPNSIDREFTRFISHTLHSHALLAHRRIIGEIDKARATRERLNHREKDNGLVKRDTLSCAAHQTAVLLNDLCTWLDRPRTCARWFLIDGFRIDFVSIENFEFIECREVCTKWYDSPLNGTFK